MRRTEALLRPATRGDLPAMARAQSLARRAAPMPPVDESTAAGELGRGWEQDELWVAEVGGVLVGYARFVRPDDVRVGWLDDLYVLPEHAGAGVGSALLDVVRAALPDGFGLWAFASNLPARAFYAARGLREVEVVEAAESPHGEAEVRLEWTGEATPVTTSS